MHKQSNTYIMKISEFAQEIVKRFSKKSSPYKITIFRDSDPYFYHVVTYKNTTGEVYENSMITERDLQSRIEFIKSQKYKEAAV